MKPAAIDVFLCHNSKDKASVIQFGHWFKSGNLSVCLDEWDLIPGLPWLDAIENVIKTSKTTAILVGKEGLGPWEVPEMRTCLMEFIRRGMLVVPILMEGAANQPDLSLFLRQYTWVDLRQGYSDEHLKRMQQAVHDSKS